MPYSEQQLEDLIAANPLDDTLRVQLEALLAETDPDCVEVELLRREREIALLLEAGTSIDEQMLDYTRFKIKESYELWEMRGHIDRLFRPFSLFLICCKPERVFALDVALQSKLQKSFDLTSFPIEIARMMDVQSAFETMNNIMDFVRRYKGPSGNEPEVMADEIIIQMIATYSTKEVMLNDCEEV